MIVSYDTIYSMRPVFEVTLKILNLCTRITRLLGQYEGLKQPRPQPILRRHSRIKSIQSSLAIEGNSLTEDQITDLLNNKRVIGPAKDILEAKNAIKAYDVLRSYRIYNIKSFLSAHKTMTRGLVKDAGELRNSNVGIFKGEKVAHVAPKFQLVPKLMDELFQFLKEESDIHPLVKSSVFHYEIEFIHPFTDGNGRMGRLWQSAILLDYHPMFEYIPIESIIKKKQKGYYQVLSEADKTGTCTKFIEFILAAIHQSAKEFFAELRPEAETIETRIALAKSHFHKRRFSRKEYLIFHKNISTATASRDLLFGVKHKILKKSGKRALTRYKF
ncbi:MAG: Fic family protein [Candidatus Gorgyraea atricola]|nr:Fic family protein [Candidatus Gorgyraea atricola]